MLELAFILMGSLRCKQFQYGRKYEQSWVEDSHGRFTDRDRQAVCGDRHTNSRLGQRNICPRGNCVGAYLFVDKGRLCFVCNSSTPQCLSTLRRKYTRLCARKIAHRRFTAMANLQRITTSLVLLGFILLNAFHVAHADGNLSGMQNGHSMPSALHSLISVDSSQSVNSTSLMCRYSFVF